MKIAIRGTLLALATVWSHQTLAASYTSPTGIWDLVSSYSVEIKTSATKKTQQIKPVLSQAQYLPDYSFKGYDWNGISGKWQQKSGSKSYNTQIDINKVNSSTNVPAYLNRVAAQFISYATQTYGSAPTVSSIKLLSYQDSASLNNDGLNTKGSISSEATLTFKNPKTQLNETAKLRIIGSYQGMRASAPSTCCTSDDGAANLIQSNNFLTQNAKLPGVITTTTGLQYKIIQKGNGDGHKPLATDKVKVSYRGYLPSGQVFDANSGISFGLNQVISGWTEGLQLMEPGDYFRFYIPPQMAYGNRSVGDTIKPNTALIFDVILQSIGNQ